MTFSVWTRYEPIMIHVVVNTKSPTDIVIKAYTPKRANTVFMDRNMVVNGKQDFYIRLPLSPWNLAIDIYNKKNGNVRTDSSFNVDLIQKEPLQITLSKTKMDTALVRNFVAFAQKFCYSCGFEPANTQYVSSVGNFKIQYLPYILREGKESPTPARIGIEDGTIQVAKHFFDSYTIPMRMAILLHEFSHYYLNTTISNEVEADLNGLTIYLGLGYPIIEAYQAFSKTFIGAPTSQNKMRYDVINKFINMYVEEHHIKDAKIPNNEQRKYI